MPAKLVLITGAGPAGLTAAMELSRLGIPVRLVEKATAPATTSRAVGVQARTLELFEQRGLAEALVSAGNPTRWVSVYDAGKRLLHLDFNHVDSRYPFLLFVSQAKTEQTLRDQLARQKVNIEWGVELVGFSQTSSHSATGGVTATLRHRDGRLEGVEASYLLGADGAHSTVRSTLDINFGGHALPDAYALGDLHADGDLPPSDLHLFSSTHGFMGMFPMGGDHFRLICSKPISEPSGDTKPSLEQLQKIYDQRSHIPARFHDLTWSSWFHINSRMVDRMHAGRAFLLGDAAHIHSPAGGQGMNTGIQDAINLCWKLAWVLHGRAKPEILETYSADRTAVIRNVLNKTEKMTEVIGTENAAFRMLFDHLAPLIVGRDFVQASATTQISQIGLNYRGSPLSETHGHHGSIQGGDRVPPNLPVAGGSLAFTKSTTTAFTLLMANGGADAESFRSHLATSLAPWMDLMQVEAIDAPTGEDGGKFAHAFGTNPMLILVRPDGYAGYVGPASGMPRLRAYVEQWFENGLSVSSAQT